MKSFLFTNAFFEEELSLDGLYTPSFFLQKHPIYFQLHYLSCLIRDPHEIPLLLSPPPPGYLAHLESLGLSCSSFALLSEQEPFTNSSLSSWGASLSLKTWAQEKQSLYSIPSFETIKQVQSKAFAFLYFPKLEKSALLKTSEDLLSWWHSFEGPKVLKTLYGSSGRGHFISQRRSCEEIEKALIFFEKNKSSSPIVVAQPWVERVFDFSSQWHLSKDGTASYLGATLCKNSSRGTYSESVAGPQEVLFKEHLHFLKEHLLHAEKAVEMLYNLSFFGNIGFDAMVYLDPRTGHRKLLPILEINARKTMGFAALKIYEKFHAQKPLSLSYQSLATNKLGLLPEISASARFLKQLLLDANPVCI